MPNKRNTMIIITIGKSLTHTKCFIQLIILTTLCVKFSDIRLIDVTCYTNSNTLHPTRETKYCKSNLNLRER